MQCAQEPETNVRGIFNKASERAASKSMSCWGGGGGLDQRKKKKWGSIVAAVVPYRMLQGSCRASFVSLCSPMRQDSVTTLWACEQCTRNSCRETLSTT
jgi:hypothetical protein